MTLKLLFLVLLDISYYLINNIRNETAPQLLYRYYTAPLTLVFRFHSVVSQIHPIFFLLMRS